MDPSPSVASTLSTPFLPLVRSIAAAALFLCIAAAQDAFEVASVKPSDPDEPRVSWFTYPGSRVVITNFTLTMLIEEAYGVSLNRITGGPRWVGKDLYSITAKAPAGSPAAAFLPPTPDAAPSPEVRAMMRSLLADRFGLKFHRETRELPVYALAIDNGGPKLKPARYPSAEPRWALRRGHIEAHNRDLTWLIAILERRFERTVLDRTGLTGRYDYDVKFEERPLRPAAGVDGSPDDTQPSLETALRTQLGLVLKSTTGPVEILVIDEAKKPGAN